MATQEESVVLLRAFIESNKDAVKACLEEQVKVTCFNLKTQRTKTMLFPFMYQTDKEFWLRNGTWEYFLSADDIKKAEERITKLNAKWEPSLLQNPASVAPPAPPAPPASPASTEASQVKDKYEKKYEAIAVMTVPERVSRIREGKKQLDDLIAQKTQKAKVVIEAVTEAVTDAVSCNHATLMSVQNLPSQEAKKQTQGLVDSTHDLARSSAYLISGNFTKDEMYKTLDAKSNGSIIGHMNRVYIRTLNFITHYNTLILHTSFVTKLRCSFNKYLPFYKDLLPHVENLTLERVFQGGMRAVPEEVYLKWADGFMLHDIGKVSAVEYYESEAAYNRDIITEHVSIGYSSVAEKTNYPREVALIVGYHHEYYGDPSGYGVYRSVLAKQKMNNPQLEPNYCISYDIGSVLECDALAYFPAKVLEIVDVYDALTDPNRKYLKPLTSAEALAVMENEFIKKYSKLDIILFEMFQKYILESVSA